VDIELMRIFYEKYFDARSNPKYENERKKSMQPDRDRRMIHVASQTGVTHR